MIFLKDKGNSIVVEINKDYPICDTDIWIKHSKHHRFYGKDLLFSKYKKIYMSDAVRQEIGRERFDDKKEDFEIGHTKYKESYSQNLIFMLRLNDNNVFGEEKRLAIERELLEYKIVYNNKTGKYESTLSDTGETVTVIMASMLGIPIILCDESKKESIINRYKSLEVRNLLDLLKIFHGNDIKHLESIRRRLSTPIKEKQEMFKSMERDINSRNRFLSKFKNKYVGAKV